MKFDFLLKNVVMCSIWQPHKQSQTIGEKSRIQNSATKKDLKWFMRLDKKILSYLQNK